MQYIVIEQPACRCKCAAQRAEISIFNALYNITADDPSQVHGEGPSCCNVYTKAGLYELNQQQQYTDGSQNDLDEEGDASSECSDCAKKDFDEPIQHQLYMHGYQNDMDDEGDLKILNGQALAHPEYFTTDESDCELCLTCLQPLSDYCLDFHTHGYVPLPDPATYMAERMIPERASFF